MSDHFNSSTPPVKKNKFYETWTFLLLFCVVLPLLIRSFLYSPFHIPSGSMKSTLLIGDYIFVSKFSYGYSRYSLPLSPDLFEGRIWFTPPKRGDVIVFRLPSTPSEDYIKRLIGLPGDTIQVKHGIVYLNGQALPREYIDNFEDKDFYGEPIIAKRYRETLPNGVSYTVLDEKEHGSLDDTDVYTVPQGHYFFMGDNRDNSLDSRVLEVVGYVPEENLVGHAERIFISAEPPFWMIWRWVSTLRLERFFTPIK